MKQRKALEQNLPRNSLVYTLGLVKSTVSRFESFLRAKDDIPSQLNFVKFLQLPPTTESKFRRSDVRGFEN